MSTVALASFSFEIPRLLMENTGKVALVTGGGSGIGEMIATALVQNGVKVYIASRKEKQLKEVRDSFGLLDNPENPIDNLLGLRGTKQERAWLVSLLHSRSGRTWYLTTNLGFPDRVLSAFPPL